MTRLFVTFLTLAVSCAVCLTGCSDPAPEPPASPPATPAPAPAPAPATTTVPAPAPTTGPAPAPAPDTAPVPAPAATTAPVDTGDAVRPGDRPVRAPAAAEPFVTPLLLVLHFNSLVPGDGVGHADLPAILALVHPGNETQRRMLEISRAAVPAIVYARAVTERFPLEVKVRDFYETALVIDPVGPATLTGIQDDRATASYPADGERTKTLELVSVDGAWWISGATFQNDPDFKLFTGCLEALEEQLEVSRALLPRLTDMVESNAFENFVSAQGAGRALSKQYLLDHPIELDQTALREAMSTYLARRRPPKVEVDEP